MPTPTTTLTTRRLALPLAIAGVLFVPATASADCVRDLYRDAIAGNVTHYYPPVCYSKALASETADIKTYYPQVDPALKSARSRDSHRHLVVKMVLPRSISGRKGAFKVTTNLSVRDLHLVLQIPGRRPVVVARGLMSNRSAVLRATFPTRGRVRIQLGDGWQLLSKTTIAWSKPLTVTVH